MMSKARLQFKPKYEKIVELLLYLAHKRPNVDHYQAIKILYLADKEHMSRYGRPITFDSYYALPYGPVPSAALDLLKKQDRPTFETFGIRELPFETQKLDKIIYIRKAKRAVDYDLFSISDLKVFDEIIDKYGGFSFGQLYNITHEDFAYTNAWRHRNEKDMRAAMKYEDMIEERSTKDEFIEEIEDISSYMQ